MCTDLHLHIQIAQFMIAVTVLIELLNTSQGYRIPAGKDTVARFTGRGGNEKLITSVQREISLVSYMVLQCN